MYIIYKQITNGSKSDLGLRSFMFNVDCSEEELETKVYCRLAELAAASNLGYRNNGSNKRVVFVIEKMPVYSIDSFGILIKDNIVNRLASYNSRIIELNVITKRANKKYSRPLDENLFKTVELKDVYSPFVRPCKSYTNGGLIWIGEGDISSVK